LPLRNSSVPRSPPAASETASWGNKSRGDELGPPEGGGAVSSLPDPTPDKLVAGMVTVSGIP
jgi:hypothetical protein